MLQQILPSAKTFTIAGLQARRYTEFLFLSKFFFSISFIWLTSLVIGFEPIRIVLCNIFFESRSIYLPHEDRNLPVTTHEVFALSVKAWQGTPDNIATLQKKLNRRQRG